MKSAHYTAERQQEKHELLIQMLQWLDRNVEVQETEHILTADAFTEADRAYLRLLAITV